MHSLKKSSVPSPQRPSGGDGTDQDEKPTRSKAEQHDIDLREAQLEVDKTKKSLDKALEDRQRISVEGYYHWGPRIGVYILIGLGDSALNYHHLLSTVGIPAIAAAGALGVALLLAWSGELLGSTFKQLPHFSNSQANDRQRLIKSFANIGISLLSIFAVFGCFLWWLKVLAASVTLSADVPFDTGVNSAQSESMTFLLLGANIVFTILAIFYGWKSVDSDSDLTARMKAHVDAKRLLNNLSFRYRLYGHN